MGHNKSRAVLVGLSAAAGVFGAAAMMSAASAPTARADDLAAIVSDIEGTLADGQNAFGTAVTDFGTSDVPGGLAALFDGLHDDTIGVPDIAYVGGVEELTNESFSLSSNTFDFNSLTAPTDFSEAVYDAQFFFTEGESVLSDIPTSLSSGDYGDAAFDQVIAPAFLLDLPVQELFIGAVESLGF
jgi:hypothetical protein